MPDHAATHNEPAYPAEPCDCGSYTCEWYGSIGVDEPDRAAIKDAKEKRDALDPHRDNI